MTKSPNESAAPTGFFGFVHAQRAMLGVVFVVLGLGLVGHAGYLFWAKKTWEAWLFAGAEIAFALVFLAIGTWQAFQGDYGSFSTDEGSRIVVMVFGGLIGFLVWLLSVVLVLFPGSVELPNLWQKTVFGGTDAWQGPDGWRMWLVLGLHLAGLAITFVSLLAVVSLERQRPILRRIVYGYNAALSCLMLFAILLVLNVLCTIYVPAVSDWTAGGLYTLSSQSIDVLGKIKKPVKVYVFETSRGDMLHGEVEALLDNCRRVNPGIQVSYLLRDRNAREVSDLAKKYQILEPMGILVVYGDDTDEAHQFIKREDLVEAHARREDSFAFKGEDQFITAVDYLAKGKKKVVVYFTQGHDELDINETDVQKLDVGASKLRERLEKANYDVKGLMLDPLAKSEKPNVIVAKSVPEDADVVVIAGAKSPFDEASVKAIRDYLKSKKGKLFVLTDVYEREGKFAKLGIESLLSEYNVEVTDDRVLSLPNEPNHVPEQVYVTVNSDLVDVNPVANALEGKTFLLIDARVIQPKRPGEEPPSRGLDAEAKVLLMTDRRFNRVWRSTDLTTPTLDQLEKLRKLTAEELSVKVARPLPVGVAVTIAGQPDLADPHAAMRGRRDRKSKLVVLGDVTWISNPVMGSRAADVLFAIFTNNVNWLHDEEKPVVGIPPKQRDSYTMSSTTNVYRLYYLPFFLMFLGIVGVGTGVWVVRRK